MTMYFKYEGLEFCDIPVEKSPAFVRFAVTWEGRTILEFYVNSMFEGMFIGEDKKQIAGTCDFQMPPKKWKARRVLRYMAEKQIEAHFADDRDVDDTRPVGY